MAKFWYDMESVLITLIFLQKKILLLEVLLFGPAHVKTYKIACVPSEDLDQPGHLSSLIRVFAVRMKKT